VVAGSYANYKSGTWIKIDSTQYNYDSPVTQTSACPGSQVATTPEGFKVNSYVGSTGTQFMLVCNPGVGYKRYK
jgi:hypothetical protein